MTKILDAMRRASSGKVDFQFQLETCQGRSLYPPPPQELMEDFEKLANSLIGLHQSAKGEVLAFASTTSGEGTSFVSYNVARHLSFMLDRKVAWVDANFVSPSKKLGDANLSFRELLLNPASISQLKVPGNLVLIPNGDTHIKTTDLLNSQNYLNLLQQFKHNFFFTILDAPPIQASVDVAHLAAPTLGLVLVVESRRLKHEIVQSAISTVRTLNVDVLGTVLNKRSFDIPGFLYKKL